MDIAAVLQAALLVTLKLCAPPLLAALVIGLGIALVQALTQISDSTVSFLPKLIAIGAALALAGPFMTITLHDYTRSLFDQMVAVGGR